MTFAYRSSCLISKLNVFCCFVLSILQTQRALGNAVSCDRRRRALNAVAESCLSLKSSLIDVLIATAKVSGPARDSDCHAVCNGPQPGQRSNFLSETSETVYCHAHGGPPFVLSYPPLPAEIISVIGSDVRVVRSTGFEYWSNERTTLVIIMGRRDASPHSIPGGGGLDHPLFPSRGVEGRPFRRESVRRYEALARSYGPPSKRARHATAGRAVVLPTTESGGYSGGVVPGDGRFVVVPVKRVKAKPFRPSKKEGASTFERFCGMLFVGEIITSVDIV